MVIYGTPAFGRTAPPGDSGRPHRGAVPSRLVFDVVPAVGVPPEPTRRTNRSASLDQKQIRADAGPFRGHCPLPAKERSMTGNSVNRDGGGEHPAGGRGEGRGG
jgi:hypothetical protein